MKSIFFLDLLLSSSSYTESCSLHRFLNGMCFGSTEETVGFEEGWSLGRTGQKQVGLLRPPHWPEKEEGLEMELMVPPVYIKKPSLKPQKCGV